MEEIKMSPIKFMTEQEAKEFIRLHDYMTATRDSSECYWPEEKDMLKSRRLIISFAPIDAYKLFKGENVWQFKFVFVEEPKPGDYFISVIYDDEEMVLAEEEWGVFNKQNIYRSDEELEKLEQMEANQKSFKRRLLRSHQEGTKNNLQ